MIERRNDSRYLCADLAQVEWLKGKEDAILEDISELGGCVQTENPIPLGSSVMLTIHDAKFFGSVCYCFYRDYGYFVGIHFSDETVWSIDKVTPEHLTNLQAIARNAAEE
jgi:hypothetical protein